MTTLVVTILEMIGTIAFAASGALVGIHKKMDVLGVLILGVVTAVGGGLFRDLVLGATPPGMFLVPRYTLAAALTAGRLFFPGVRSWIEKNNHLFEKALLYMDSVGLGVFTVVGIEKAVTLGFGDNAFLCIFVGVLTGVGGGLIRDIMADEMPGIFVKKFYATASIAGALICVTGWPAAGPAISMAVGAIMACTLNLGANYLNWNLPKA